MSKKRSTSRAIPIYTTAGDCLALLAFPYIFNTMGEWIGWVTPNRQVYSVLGIYIGWLTDEPRILRKRIIDGPIPRLDPPKQPKKIRIPAALPLPPMMAELPFEVIDVLFEEPERLHTIDAGELKEDMD
jgi:hypothetical protein